MTKYNEYDTYSQGDSWDYNDEMQRLFEDRFAKDVIANRPTETEAPDNAIFEATDEKLVYRNDPSNGWVVEGGTGTSSTPVPEQYVSSLDAEKVQNNISDAAIQVAWDGLVVPIGPGLGADSAIDPANSSTPVQDARNLADTVAVLLPPESVSDEGPAIDDTCDNISFMGWGIDPSGAGNGSVIKITDTANSAIDIQSSTGEVSIDGITFEGPAGDNLGTQTQPAYVNNGSVVNWTVGTISFTNWRNEKIFENAAGAGWFQSTYNHLDFTNVDTGDGGFGSAVLEFGKVGNGVEMNHVSIYPDLSGSGGTNCWAFSISKSFSLRIGSVNIGGECRRIGQVLDSYVNIDYINFEPSTLPGSAPGESLVIRGPGGGPRPGNKYVISRVKTALEANAGRVVTVDGCGPAYVGPIHDATGNYDPLLRTRNAINDPVGPVVTDVPIADIADDAGGNEALYSRADGKFADPVDSVSSTQISSGGTSTLSFANLTAVSEDLAPSDLDVTVTGRGAASDVGYSVDKVWYDDSAGNWKANLSETEANTTITVDVEVQRRA